MLTQFFLMEFDRIIKFAGACTKKAGTSEEKLFLTIISIASYLKAQPEILLALDWTRTRQLNFKRAAFPKFNWIISDIKLKRAGADHAVIADQMAQWVFFLVINTLMRRPDGMDFSDVSNCSFRTLYRFISLGLEGLNL